MVCYRFGVILHLNCKLHVWLLEVWGSQFVWLLICRCHPAVVTINNEAHS